MDLLAIDQLGLEYHQRDSPGSEEPSHFTIYMNDFQDISSRRHPLLGTASPDCPRYVQSWEGRCRGEGRREHILHRSELRYF